jgi:hypothetical protein
MTNSAVKDQRREFEMRIGYDDAVKRHVGNEAVQFDWLKFEACRSLPGWTVDNAEHTALNVGDFADQWTFYFRNSAKAIKATITSFRKDELAALKAIAEYSHASNMVPPPYGRGPQELGTISIVSDVPSSYAVYWAFRNVKFDVDGNDKAAVLAAARCLQNVAAANSRPQ